MIRSFWDEEWKPIKFDDGIADGEYFKISNYGRIINCKGEEEYLVKKSYINGYQNLRLKTEKTANKPADMCTNWSRNIF